MDLLDFQRKENATFNSSLKSLKTNAVKYVMWSLPCAVIPAHSGGSRSFEYGGGSGRAEDKAWKGGCAEDGLGCAPSVENF